MSVGAPKLVKEKHGNPVEVQRMKEQRLCQRPNAGQNDAWDDNEQQAGAYKASEGISPRSEVLQDKPKKQYMRHDLELALRHLDL
mmetsp:Transcript_92198/g.183087  ORF Transcript_92198/g.183087 Transcript_92198/m.183087 type:complete len:85 (-) Transcript_92198:194-448(-)|eukprot:CAMPEP_0172743672 /NCGR_PEP_ID=MMETSP1074-20121228/132873_1 /TAXON_ID=2916 /ORGANISM="Ceratium fusus, Strain PA161109" /LENGTH=84 /DNA_ID=CAMNT_0013574435 /DNA_START=207 /DNA_END=461 /DNA_ORIENTATION=-